MVAGGFVERRRLWVSSERRSRDQVPEGVMRVFGVQDTVQE